MSQPARKAGREGGGVEGDRQRRNFDCHIDSFQAIRGFVPDKINFLHHFLRDILMTEPSLNDEPTPL